MTKSGVVILVGPEATLLSQFSLSMNQFSIVIQIRGLSTLFKVRLLALKDIASFGCFR